MVQPLYKYVYYLCGNQDEAYDIVQDAFVKFYEKIDTIDTQGQYSYLYQSAKNIFLNRAKKKSVRLQFQSKPRNEEVATDPQFQLEQQEFKIKLETAISALPEGQREVFLLSRLEGKKYREIAELLGVSQKAVEKRMSLALSELRKLHKKI